MQCEKTSSKLPSGLGSHHLLDDVVLGRRNRNHSRLQLQQRACSLSLMRRSKGRGDRTQFQLPQASNPKFLPRDRQLSRNEGETKNCKRLNLSILGQATSLVQHSLSKLADLHLLLLQRLLARKRYPSMTSLMEELQRSMEKTQRPRYHHHLVKHTPAMLDLLTSLEYLWMKL